MTVTNVLIALNVIAYIWEVWPGSGGGTLYDRILNGPDSAGLFAHGALYGPAVTQLHQYWRIVSGAFLHGGLVHIGLNMFALYQVGTLVERLLGGTRMLVIYLLSMIGAGIAVVVFSPESLTVGASGAIFGLFGALVGIGWRLGKPGRGLVGQVLPIVVLNLVFTFSVPNISAAAHVGGLLTGFLVGIAAYEMRPRRALVPVAEEQASGEQAEEAAADPT